MRTIMQGVCLFWLMLLFCVLGSTSEEFFSPILSQLSEEMGLPPRFAGGEQDLQDHVQRQHVAMQT